MAAADVFFGSVAAGRLIPSERPESSFCSTSGRSSRSNAHIVTASTSTTPETSAAHRWRVLAICVLVIVSTALSPPLIRVLGLEFWLETSLSQRQESIVTALAGFGLVLMILASGVIGDLYGRRRVLVGLIVLHVVSLGVAMLLSGTELFLWSLRFVAVVKAMIAPLVLAILIEHYSGKARLQALVIYSTLSALAYLAVPWADRWFLTNGATLALVLPPIVASLVSAYLVRRYVPGEADQHVRPRPASVIAIAFWAASICSLAYGVLLLLGLGVSAVLPYLFLALGIGGLLLIRHFEQHPIAEGWHYSIYRERPLAIAIIVGIVLILVLRTVSTNLYYFFTGIQDVSIVIASLRLLPVLLGGFLLGALAVRITDSRSEHSAIAAGMATIGLATAGLTIMAPDVPYWFLAPSLLVLGLGYVLANSPRLLLLAHSVPERLDASVQAIGVATSTVGGAMAYSLTLGLISLFTRRIYSSTLADMGASQAFINEQLALVDVVVRASEGMAFPEQQAAMAAAIVPAFEYAFVVALARTMLVLAGVCFLVALLAYYGLREEDIDTSAPPIEIEFVEED